MSDNMHEGAPRRLAYVRITSELVAQMLLEGWNSAKHQIACTKGIPPDARLFDLWCMWQGEYCPPVITLVFEHSSFALSYDGEPIPEWGPCEYQIVFKEGE